MKILRRSFRYAYVGMLVMQAGSVTLSRAVPLKLKAFNILLSTDEGSAAGRIDYADNFAQSRNKISMYLKH